MMMQEQAAGLKEKQGVSSSLFGNLKNAGGADSQIIVPTPKMASFGCSNKSDRLSNFYSRSRQDLKSSLFANKCSYNNIQKPYTPTMQ